MGDFCVGPARLSWPHDGAGLVRAAYPDVRVDVEWFDPRFYRPTRDLLVLRRMMRERGMLRD